MSLPAPITAHLVVVRHGESTNNAVERLTGWRDVELTARGRAQARAAGALLRARGLHFSVVFTSLLRRATESADLLMHELGHGGPERRASWRLNERHCGALHGLTKAEIYARFGAVLGRVYRRSWETAPPPAIEGGPDDPRADPRYRDAGAELPLTESMRDLWQRVHPVWTQIEPLLEAGQNVLVVGHGLALRALARSIEGSTEPALPAWKLASAAPRWYRFAHGGRIDAIEDLATSAAGPDE